MSDKSANNNAIDLRVVFQITLFIILQFFKCTLKENDKFLIEARTNKMLAL